jgi:hypothetical protein
MLTPRWEALTHYRAIHNYPASVVVSIIANLTVSVRLSIKEDICNNLVCPLYSWSQCYEDLLHACYYIFNELSRYILYAVYLPNQIEKILAA